LIETKFRFIKMRELKKLSIILCTLCMGFTMAAQPGVISTRPANDSKGKILTTEETTLSRELVPKWYLHEWEGETKVEFPKEVTKGKSLYIAKAEGDTVLVAESENSQITYGQVVSRNEFGIEGGTFWSPSRDKLAFYRKDESRVTTFPLLDITSRTGSLVEIKYPMAGMGSENVQLGVYDLATAQTVYVKADEFGYDRYLTNITWSPDGTKIFIQVLDRSQKHLKLNMYDAATGDFIKTILTEDNEKYVEPQDPIWFIKGSNDLFIYRTDNRDGYRNLYLCDTEGNIRRLTETDADVAYIANDGKHVWYTSAEVSPVENHLFRIGIKLPSSIKGLSKVKFSKAEQLTKTEGWHSITMSPDLTEYVDMWSNVTTPRVTDLCSSDGKLIKNLLTSEDPTLDYAYTEICLGTVKSADGLHDNYYRMIKPLNFDPSKKYPTIVYVYGGPHSQMVTNTYLANLRRWEMHMAQRGYLVYVQDNRGTSNRGAAFEKAIHGQCGQAEMADQMEGVKMLMSLPYVDKDRIGVHGWSYGGFMTISLITNYPDIFKVAVAGGPVIDWKWYEVMYGERYMDNPEVNPEGYAKTSLINKAKDLKGKLLICQGAVDPVVVWEHSLSFVRECVKNNVQVDYFPYPCAEHNVMGKDRVHLNDKITMYFEDYL
jgi:dipeptidyl-peptidase-4